MKKLILVTLAVVTFASAQLMAAVNFRVGPSYNLYTDSRYTGMSTQYEVSYKADAFEIGYKIEQENITVKDDQNSANNIRLSSRLNLLSLHKRIVSVSDVNVNVVLDFGPMEITPLEGTVAIAGSEFAQVVPVIVIAGEVEYMNDGKILDAGLFVRIGYRYCDINDSTPPNLFTAGIENYKSLNAVKFDVGLKVIF